MKIDKEKLRAISEKSDAELWQTISGIAKSHGYNLPEKAPGKDEMQKIRSIMQSPEKLSMKDAVKLMNEYKKRG